MHTSEPRPPAYNSLEIIDDTAGLKWLAEQWVSYYGGTGDKMSDEQEGMLAMRVQAGLHAQKTLEKNSKRPHEDHEQLRDDIRQGQLAQRALVETNLRFAYKYASISMGRQDQGLLEKRKARQQTLPTGGYAPGTYRALLHSKSPYADLQDRKQAAVIGLIDAASKFKPNRKARFTTFAAWFVQHEIDRNKYDTEHNGVRVPVHQHERITAHFREHPSLLPGEKIPEDITRLIRLLDYIRLDDSLVNQDTSDVEAPAATEDDDVARLWRQEYDYPDGLEDIISSHQEQSLTVEEEVEFDMLREAVNRVLSDLSDRQAGVISMRFGLGDNEPMTLDQVGRVYDFTRERIRQIQAKAMSSLRTPSRLAAVEPFVQWNAGGHIYQTRWRGDELVLGGATVAASSVSIRDEVPIAPVVPEERKDLGDDRSSVLVERKAELEAWQAYGGEPWELSERSGEFVPGLYDADDKLLERLEEYIHHMQVYHFQDSFAQAVNTPFPVAAMNRLREMCGNRRLAPQQISQLWDGFVTKTLPRMQSQANDVSYDRVGLFFSRIMLENLSSDDEVHLAIPGRLAGKVGHLASHLKVGTVIIHGRAGDYLASHNKGYARVVAEGAADAAGALMHGNATLLVNGRAGHKLGIGAFGDATITTAGYASKGPAAESVTFRELN